MEDEKRIESAFQRCAERKWLKELIPATITEQEIAGFEQKYDVNIPSCYKAFLTSYRLPCDMFQICGIANYAEETHPLWLILYGINQMSELAAQMEAFREDVAEFRAGTADMCRKLIPIGDWGAAWGPLCIDLTRPDELVDEQDESTWSLVWFDHEEFDWGEECLGENGLLRGAPAAPNFQTLLDWYFRGSLESEFEAENQVKVSYERLNDREFCSSYWEDKWKE